MTLRRGHILTEKPEIGPVRELTRPELAHLVEKRPPTVVQTLRDSHHRMARAVASGLTNAEVAALCGCSANRVSILRSDPSFRELVAHKRAMIDVEWAAEADPVIDHLRTNALKAQAMLSDKLDAAVEQNEFLPTRDLLGIAELGLDRTGYGKVNKNVNINVDFAAKLEAARNRSAGARGPATVIEAEVIPAPRLQSVGVPARSPPQSPFRRRA